MLIGRLTRDPEIRVFASGGKVASFGFAVNNRKKNPQSGQWEEEPVFLDCDAFNGGGEFAKKTADLVEQYLRKGYLAYIEGHLKLDKWNDKTTGQERQRIKIVVDNVQFLQPKGDGSVSYTAGSKPIGAAPPQSSPSSMGEESYDPGPSEPMLDPPPSNRPEEDIPF